MPGHVLDRLNETSMSLSSQDPGPRTQALYTLPRHLNQLGFTHGRGASAQTQKGNAAGQEKRHFCLHCVLLPVLQPFGEIPRDLG